jgi:uncharacterized protein (TIGR01777 family)
VILTVTGATGFIGTRLAGRLRGEGHEIRIVSRRGPFTWERIAEAVDGSAALIHLAGEPVAQRWNAEVKRRIRGSRVVTTRRLVDAIGGAKHRPSALVSASAIGYYGERGEELLTEESPPGRDFLAEVCVEWEREAARATEFGLRVANPRIGIVLGREGGMLNRTLTPFRVGVGGRIGSGRQWMSWIHVDDLVNMIAFAATSPALTGPFNATAPNPVRNSEFTAVLARTVHRPAILPVPAFALKALFGEMAEVILASQRVEPRAAATAGFVFQYPQLDTALASLVC